MKIRDSDIILKLKASGMTYRQLAHIAKCYSGAVRPEMRAIKLEFSNIHENIKQSNDLRLDKEIEKIKESEKTKMNLKF